MHVEPTQALFYALYLHPSGSSHCIFRIAFIMCINHSCSGVHCESFKYTESGPQEPWVLTGDLLCGLMRRQEVAPANWHCSEPGAVWIEDGLIMLEVMLGQVSMASPEVQLLEGSSSWLRRYSCFPWRLAR